MGKVEERELKVIEKEWSEKEEFNRTVCFQEAGKYRQAHMSLRDKNKD